MPNPLVAKTKRHRAKSTAEPDRTEASGPVPGMAQSAAAPTLVRTVLDRVGDLSSVWGPYQSFVAVLTIIGVCSLHLARADAVLPITTMVIAAMLAPLIARIKNVL